MQMALSEHKNKVLVYEADYLYHIETYKSIEAI